MLRTDSLIVGLLITLTASYQTQAAESEVGNPAIRRSVVKVHSTRRSPIPFTPWRRGSSSSVSGSGVVIDGNRILTNFHVVASSVDTSVSLDGTSEKLSASVEVVSPEMDLAIIKLDTASSESLPDPLPIAEKTPADGTKIQVLGFPTGGDSLSVTEGVISRLEYAQYRNEGQGLRLQIDAPLNSGNSGGPVVANGEIVAINFGGLSKANDVGYAIPAEELRIFLDDVADGSYDKKFQTWWLTQSLESEPLRRWLKVPKSETGIRFTNVPFPAEGYPLLKNDVVTHIGEFDVSNSGQVEHESGRTVFFGYAVDRSCTDGKLQVRILRDGELMELEIPLFRDGNLLLKYFAGETPPYFVHGPLVFSVGSLSILSSMDSMRKSGGRGAQAADAFFKYMHISGNPYFLRRYDRISRDQKELVTLTRVLTHSMTRDIKVMGPATISKINGVPIKNIKHCADVIRSLKSELIEIEIDDRTHTMIVLDRTEVEKAHDQLLEDNGIVRPASKGLEAE